MGLLVLLIEFIVVAGGIVIIGILHKRRSSHSSLYSCVTQSGISLQERKEVEERNKGLKFAYDGMRIRFE